MRPASLVHVTCLLAAVASLWAQPRRIVSTAPSITEALFALGLGDRVAGVTQYCHFPPEALRLPKIGSFLQPNIELVLSLKPDLVVIQKNPVNLKARLEGVNLPVLEIDNERLAGIYTSLRTLGAATGTAGKAGQLVAGMEASLAAIRVRAARRPARKIMFIVGRSPGRLEGLVAVGRANYLNELLTIAGGVNIFAEALSAYPKVTLEDVLSRNPDVIIDMGDMSETTGVTDSHKRAVVDLWKRYPTLAAVKNGRVFAVAADIFVVPGPRAVEAAAEFDRMLQ